MQALSTGVAAAPHSSSRIASQFSLMPYLVYLHISNVLHQIFLNHCLQHKHSFVYIDSPLTQGFYILLHRRCSFGTHQVGLYASFPIATVMDIEPSHTTYAQKVCHVD